MKKVVLFASMLCLAITGFSQPENIAPERKIRIGFDLGAAYSNLQSMETLPDNAQISNGFGAVFGVFMDYSISRHLIFSPKAELSINNCRVDFSNPDNSLSSYEIFPVSLDFMTHMLYKFGDGKVSPYILAGPDFKLPLSNKPASTDEFSTSPDLAIDFGIGLEKRNPLFHFCTRIEILNGTLEYQ